jgi:hypothetical protein
MTDPVAGCSPNSAYTATPTQPEIAAMIDGLDAVDPRPALSSWSPDELAEHRRSIAIHRGVVAWVIEGEAA